MPQTVLNPADYAPDRSFTARVRRRLTQWRSVNPIKQLPSEPMISFSFDDFPISAAEAGAEIMDRYNIKATYYACSGLSGRENQTGPQYLPSHMFDLVGADHEIGAHTHTHLDCASRPTPEVLSDIDLNLNWLKDHSIEVQNFAYPYGETSVSLKRALSSSFSTSRGILPGINRAGNDLTQLRAVELTSEAWTHKRAEKAIEDVNRWGGWLIFFTHDVRRNPSGFGIEPDQLDAITRQAGDSGAELVTVLEAAARLARLTI